MIQNNKFFLKNFKNVVFLGQSEIFEKLIDANSSIGLNTFLVTSSDQAKNISSSLEPNIFDKIDDSFKKFVTKNCTIEETLFISMGARYIFKKDTRINYL